MSSTKSNDDTPSPSNPQPTPSNTSLPPPKNPSSAPKVPLQWAPNVVIKVTINPTPHKTIPSPPLDHGTDSPRQRHRIISLQRRSPRNQRIQTLYNEVEWQTL